LEEPYRFLAVQGTIDMVESNPGRLVATIPEVTREACSFATD
jgi:hypothetical protein